METRYNMSNFRFYIMADLEMDSEFVLISEATGNLQELFTFFKNISIIQILALA